MTALAGCDAEPSPPPPPDPLQPLLDQALALAAAYDRAIAADPGASARLTPLAADHRAHAAELTKLITPIASAAASAGTTTTDAGTTTTDNGVAGLRAAEQAAQRNAVAACKAAPADRAALVGSIAACRATHAEALR
ncbi:hypothetical protein ACIA5D_01505 [Actinoplanes sp. NPDC051513]|uniref:hypothetical protein n=1 Tax=Actinoplanes sp. NPDC051513 TaxID=3363908 RepID=UPI00379A7246